MSIETGGNFIDDVIRKPIDVTVDGIAYRVRSSEDAYDLEILNTGTDTVIGYIARLDSSAAGFVPVAEVNQVQPDPQPDLEAGIRELARLP